MTPSTLRTSLWKLPFEITRPPALFVSWDPATKRPGAGELWRSDPTSLRSAWSVLQRLEQQQLAHLGIARIMRDDIVALDLDKVVETPRDLSTLVDWARPIVELVFDAGYMEWSHSGRGLHILLRDVPETWQRKRLHRLADGTGWDWIIGENLCHITLDVVNDDACTSMVSASAIIPLLEALMPAAEPPVAPPAPRPVVLPATAVDITRYQAYGTAGMDRELDRLAQTIEGGRNHALNRAAYALGQLYAGGCIVDVDRYSEEIMNTALAIGLDRGEVRATFRSGFEAGQNTPRTPPDRPERKATLPPRKGPSEAPQATKPATPVSTPDSTPAPQQQADDATTYAVASDGITLAELQHMHFKPLRWVIEDIAPEGALLIAAKPKAKKSWLALNLGLAIAMGGRALGRYNVLGGDVLYLDLEGNQRRIQSRVRQILGVQEVAWPANFTVHTQWGVGDDCILRLRHWLFNHPQASAVVVDLLHEIRPPLDPREDRYAYDRRMLVELNKLAEEFHVCIMIIHHTRKMKGDDVFDEISGTLGITGAVSTIWVLSKAQDGTVTLNVQGRDLVHDDPLALEWDAMLCGFRVSGLASEVAVSDTRRRIIEFLDDDQQHSPREIAEAIEASVGSVDQQLRQMLSAGVVEKSGYGRWRLIRRA